METIWFGGYLGGGVIIIYTVNECAVILLQVNSFRTTWAYRWVADWAPNTICSKCTTIIPRPSDVSIDTISAGNYIFNTCNYNLVRDNSGIRLHYTRRLRENDGGMIISGVSVSDTQMIPPQQKMYRNVGICGPSCTSSVSTHYIFIKCR